MTRNLMPAFLDFETSSLSLQPPLSYPVSVGIAALDDTRFPDYHALIRPADDWTDWDPKAQDIHKISQDVLLESGQPALEVLANIREFARHHFLLVTSRYDVFWLRRLEEAVNDGKPAVLLRGFQNSLAGIARSQKHLDKAYASAGHTHPHTHNALDDARHMRQVVLNLMSPR